MTSGLQRVGLEKYYTLPDVALFCVNLFKKHVQIESKDLIIEPSAGNGSFSNILFELFPDQIRAYDIQPDERRIEQQDFLILNPPKENVHIVGNPPFGRQSTLAKNFIKKASSFASSISFILPKSFKKDSFQKAFPHTFHLFSSTDLPDNSFLLEGKNHDVPCVFQIWIKRDTPRDKPKVQTPKYFSFVKKDEDPQFSIRRVGVNSGTLSLDTSIQSSQSNYFLKLTDSIDLEQFTRDYNRLIHFEFNNSVGPKSISKPELISKLNEIYLFLGEDK